MTDVRPPPAAARSRGRASRRALLIACTALTCAAGAQAAYAGPTGASIPAGVANAPTITASGGDTRVQLNQQRTIIDWKTFSVSKGESLDFVFASRGGLVLNRVDGKAAIDGVLKGCVVTCSVIGGNVWVYASNGVVFGPNARVSAGSFLATTSPLSSEKAFLSGATDFTFAAGNPLAKIDVQSGAQLAATGGALALISPQVETQAGSSVSAAGTALVAAAQTYTIRFDASAGGDLDLLDFQVPASALEDGTVAAKPLAVSGQAAGQSVVLAAVSRPSVMNAVISLGDVAVVGAARADASGAIVLSAAPLVQVAGAVTGGRAVSLQATDGGSIAVSGQVTARDAAGHGGVIAVGDGATGSAILAAGGVLDAASTAAGAKGGAVSLTAQAVDVEGRVDASGPAGGGSVRLGGGARGQDATLANAATTVIGAGATIAADATSSGNGGSVVLWSDTATDFTGRISALGGPLGGDGGAAEVSGGHLTYAGVTDLRAPHGVTGTLLLDPHNVTISTAPDSNQTAFTATADDSFINTTTLQNALATAAVTVSTGVDGTTQPGDIKVTDPVTWTSGSTLSLMAAGQIKVEAELSGVNAGVILHAGSDISQSGIIQAATLSATSTGGAVYLTQPNMVGGLNVLSASTMGSFTDGNETLAVGLGAIKTGGAASVTTAGLLTVDANPVVAAGSLSLTSTGAGVTVGGPFTLLADTTVTANNGVVTFSGAVRGGHALTTSSLNGTSFGGAVGGGGAPLASLDVTGPATVTGNVSATGTITFGDNGGGALTLAPSLGAGITVGSTGGNVSFGAIADQTANTDSLTVNVATGFAASFNGDVGTTPLGGLTVNGASTLRGDVFVANTGAIAFNGALTIAPTGPNNFTTALTGGSVSVTTVDGATPYLDMLEVSVGGAFTATGGSIATAVMGGLPSGTVVALGGTRALGGFELSADTATFGSTNYANPVNQVGQLAVHLASGALTFTDMGTGPGAEGLEITSFAPDRVFSGGLSGVTTNAQAISLTGQGLAVAAPIISNGATVTLKSTSTDTFSPYVLVLDAAVNAGAGGTLNLSSGTQILQLPSSQYVATAFTAGTLNVSSNGMVTLTQANALGTLASLDTTGDYAASVTSSGMLEVSGTATAHGGALTLTGGGGLRTDAGVALTGGSVTLDGGGTSVEVDGAVTAAPATTAPATTPSGSGVLTIQDGSITLGAASNLSATGGVTLGNASSITQAQGGVIGAGSLVATATGAISLASSQNAFTSVTAATSATTGAAGANSITLQTTAPLAITYQSSALPGLTTQNGAITVTAAGLSLAPAYSGATAPSIVANGGGVSLTSAGGAGVTLAGLVQAPATQTITLTTQGSPPGAITESGAGAISAGTLAFTGGAVTLASASNQVATIQDGSSSTGAVTFTDNQSLTVGALTVGGNVALTTVNAMDGNLYLTGDFKSAATGNPVGAPGNVTLIAAQTLDTPSLTVAGDYAVTAATFNTTTAGGRFAGELTPTLTGAASAFSATQTMGDIDLASFPTTMAPGALSLTATNGSVLDSGTTSLLKGASITVTGQSVVVSGVTATSGAVTLLGTAGGVSQKGGVIQAASLSATATGGAVTLTNANLVGTLTLLKATGGTNAASFTDGAIDLSVAANALSAPGMVTVTGGQAITYAALGGPLALTTAAGAGDAVTFTDVVGSSSSPLTSLAVNSAAEAEAAITTTGALTFGGPLTIAPAAAHTLTLTSTGGSISVARVDDAAALQDTLVVSAPNGAFTASGSLGAAPGSGVALGGLAITAQTASFANGVTNDVTALAVNLLGTNGQGSPLNFDAGSAALKIDAVGGLAGIAGIATHGADVIITSGALTLNADVNANLNNGNPGGFVTLTSTGAISQTGGGIMGQGLTAKAGSGGSVTLGSSTNAVNDLIQLTGAGATFRDNVGGAGLAVDRADAGTGALSIENSGDLTIASPTMLGAGTSIALTSDMGSVRFAGAFSLPADTTVAAALGSVTFDGAVDGPHALTVSASTATNATGRTTFGAVGQAQALTMLTVNGPATATAAIGTSGDQAFTGALTLQPSNGALITLGSIGGKITVASVDGATANADSLAVTAHGAFTATGAIGASSPLAGLGITAASAGLQSGNSVGTLAASLGASLSAFTFDNGAHALTIGMVNGASGVTVGGSNGASLSAGSLTLNAPVNVGMSAPLLLSAVAGGISQNGAAGAITAGSLSATATQGVTLTGPSNKVGALTLLSDAAGDTAGVAFTDALPAGTPTPVTVLAADGGGGNVTLIIPTGIQVNGLVQAGAATGAQQVTLTSTGAPITEGSGGQVVAGALSASGTTVTLDGATNGVGRLTLLKGGAGATFYDAAPGLAVVAADAGSGDLVIKNTAGSVELSGAAGAVTAGSAGGSQNVTLSAAGLLSQDAGSTITTHALTAQGAGVQLTEANAVQVLTKLVDTGAGGASFTAAGGLTVLSATGSGLVALTAKGGDLQLSGTGVSAGTATLTASGAIGQDTGGVSAGVLTGSSGGDFALKAAGNAVGRMQLVSAGGALALTDSVPLTLGGTIGAASVTLIDTGAITQDASGALTTGTLTTQTSGGLQLLGGNAIGTAASLVNSGGVGIDLQNASTALLTVVKADSGSGPLTLKTGGALLFTGAVRAGGQTAMLTAGGAISQQAGASLAAGVVTGRSAGGFVLDQTGNAFATARDITTSGPLTLTTGVGLALAGAISTPGGALKLTAPTLNLASDATLAAGSATLTSTSGPVSLLGAVNVSGQMLVSAAGAVTQGTIPVTTGAFGATAVGGITLPFLTTPAIVSLTNTGSGDIVVTVANSATSGAVTDTVGKVTLVDTTGSLAFTAPVLAGDVLTLTAQGALSGTSAQSTGASATLTGAGLAFTGPVSAQTTLTAAAGAGAASFGALATATGDLTVTAGGVIGVSSAVNVGRDYILTGADFSGVALSPTFAAGTGRDFKLTDTAGGLIYASLHAPRDLIVLATDPGAGDAAPISGGALTSDAGSISVTGTSVSLGGAVTAQAGTVTLLGAVGAVRETGAGAITTGSLSVTAGGGIALGGANLVPTVTGLNNTGGGGVLFDDVAPAVAVASATTGGGDIALDASGGSLTVSTALVSPGALTLASAGALNSLAVTSAGALTISAQGVALLGPASSGGSASVDAGAGAASLQSLDAGGDASVSGGSVTGAAVTAAGSVSIVSPGTVSVAQIQAVGGDLTLSGAALAFTGGGAGGSATLTSAGAIGYQDLSAGAALTIAANGPLVAGVTSAGSDLGITGAGPVTMGALSVGRNLKLTTPGAATIGAVRSGAAGDLSIAAQDIIIGAVGGSMPTAGDVLATGPSTTVELAASRDATLAVSGPAQLTRVSVGRNASLLTVGGDLGVASVNVGGSFAAAAQGGSLRLADLALSGSGPFTATASVDVALGAGGATLAVAPGLLSVQAGRDVLVSYANDVALASVAAGRNAVVTAGGALTLPVLTSGGDATLTGAALTVGSATVGGGLAAHALSADALLGAATVGGDLSLSADAGSATLQTVHMTGAVAGARALTITAARDAVLGRASASGAAGALQLDDASRTAVRVRSTGATGGVARVDVAGDAQLTQVASASGDVVVAATGAVAGAPTDGVLFQAAHGLTVTAGGGVTMGGASTAGGAALVDAGGALTLASLTGGTVRLRAADLTLSGGAQATATCSGPCAAPTLAIESRNGLLTVGDAPAGSAFTAGGMTVDAGELGRLKGADVALYAGSSLASGARGDLQAGDFKLDGSAIGVLRLLAGPAQTVRLAGTILPTTSGSGALVVGGASAAAGWTPKSIYLTGSVGESSSGGVGGAGVRLGSLELDAVKDVLIGGPAFVTAVSAAEPSNGGSAVGAINITRGLPVGVQATPDEINRDLVTTGVLTLRADGYVVQQNTAPVGQQGGLLLGAAGQTTPVLTLGRTGSGGAGTPALIDLSLSLFTSSGGLISRQVVASSPSIDLDDLTRSDAYRINGCAIGGAGACTPLPNTIVDVRIDKLVEGVQISTEDPPPVDDPTITGAGNEEIWRGPACAPDSGRPCR